MMFQSSSRERPRSILAACTIAVASLALGAPAAHAGIALVQQSGTVSATVTDSPDAGGAVVDTQTDSADALSRSASADDGAGNAALATQQVAFSGDEHFEVTGTIRAQSAGNRTIARSMASVTFDVDDANGFSYDILFNAKYNGVFNPDARFGSRGSFKLTSLTGGPPTDRADIDFSRSFLVDDGTSDTPPSDGFALLQGSGLQAGRYRLDFDFNADSIGGNTEATNYSLTFDRHGFGNPGGGGGGGGGNPPPAVPLPPAAFAGLATFGLMGARKLLRRRRRRGI
jgi:hypothetical protein